MPQYQRPPKKKHLQNNWVIIINLIISTVVLFSLFNILGAFGNIVRNIAFGLLGLSAYALAIIVIIICIFKLVYKQIEIDRKKALRYLPLLTIGILAVHTITTQNYQSENFGSYLKECYSFGMENAGGLIFGLFVYPISRLGYSFALAILVVAFFSVAFISLYPLFLSSGNFRTKNVKYSKLKNERNNFQGEAKDIAVGNELFIGTPDGRTRNNKIIKKSSFSSSKEREFDIMFPNKIDMDSETHEDNLIDKIKKKGSYDILFTNSAENNNESEQGVSEDINKSKSLIFPTVTNEEQETIKSELKPVISQDDKYANYTLGYRKAQIQKSLEEDAEIKNNGKRLGIFDTTFDSKEKQEPYISKSEQKRLDMAKNKLYGENDVKDDKDETFESLYINDNTNKPPIKKQFIDLDKRKSYDALYSDDLDNNNNDSKLELADLPKKVFDKDSSKEDYYDNILKEQPSNAKARGLRSDIGKFHNTKPMKDSIMDNKVDLTQVSFVDSPTAIIKKSQYKAPPEDLLKMYPKVESSSIDEHQERCMALRNVLLEYGIDTVVDRYTVGPSFTRYEITMPIGVTVKKIQQISDDIAMRLKANKLRIEAPIPGKNAVGVEIANNISSIVGIREGIRSHSFKKGSELSFLLGVNISGEVFTCNIAKMPHLLIAGATGAGKSVCINALICSLIYKYSPDHVRLILIDPKRVELSLYNGLPHLLIPEVIYEAEKAINAMNWATKEMERRYELFHKMRVRNLDEHNRKAEDEGMPTIPYIVIVIDELADLMTYKKRDIEEKIKRLAQLARAAGIHLIFATQRPSVDIITGTIKANFPSRIAFAVTSFPDSKTILDHSGAEKLRGQGDMLYAPTGAPDPIRLQGAFISNEEVEAITDYVKEHNVSYYDESIDAEINSVKSIKSDDNNSVDSSNDSEDEIFAPALKLIIESKQASISMIQRRFAVGYARAARLIDEMELKGYIGPADGSKPRDVKITMEEYTSIYGDVNE